MLFPKNVEYRPSRALHPLGLSTHRIGGCTVRDSTGSSTGRCTFPDTLLHTAVRSCSERPAAILLLAQRSRSKPITYPVTKIKTKVTDVNKGETVSKSVPVVTLYRFTTCTWLWSKLSRDRCYRCRHHRISGQIILDSTQRNQRLLQRSGFKERARYPALRSCESQNYRIEGETVTRSKACGDAAARLATFNVRAPWPFAFIRLFNCSNNLMLPDFSLNRLYRYHFAGIYDGVVLLAITVWGPIQVSFRLPATNT